MTLAELALLGTARHEGPLPPTGTPADGWVESLGIDTVERRLLLAAGAARVLEAAGVPPVRGVSIPLPAEPDRRPECSAGSMTLLREILEGEHSDLLAEALRRLDALGLRLRPALLPEVLAVRDDGLRAAVLPVLGSRGRWLATMDGAWGWALASASDEEPFDEETIRRAWDEGAPAERRAALARLRRHDPVRAREWLVAAWPQEKPERRVELLTVTSVSLSLADEPWLESLLAERSAAVRRAAAQQLAVIPGSRLAARARERAAPLLSYEPPRAGGVLARLRDRLARESPAGRLEASLPPAFEKEWERDGIAAKPPKGRGERQHSLVELLALVPPAFWQERWGAEPAALVAAAWTGEWAPAVALALSRAALLHDAKEWMAPLFEGWLSANELEGAAAEDRGEMLQALLAAMPPEARGSCVTRLVEQDAPALQPVDFVGVLPEPWSEALGRSLLGALQRAGRAGTKHLPALGAWTPAVRTIGRALPPSCFDEALALPPVEEPHHMLHYAWNKACAELQERIALRRRVLEEIEP